MTRYSANKAVLVGCAALLAGLFGTVTASAASTAPVDGIAPVTAQVPAPFAVPLAPTVTTKRAGPAPAPGQYACLALERTDTAPMTGPGECVAGRS